MCDLNGSLTTRFQTAYDVLAIDAAGLSDSMKLKTVLLQSQDRILFDCLILYQQVTGTSFSVQFHIYS